MKVTAQGQSIEEEEFYRPDRLFLMILRKYITRRVKCCIYKHFIPYEEVDLLLNWYH